MDAFGEKDYSRITKNPFPSPYFNLEINTWQLVCIQNLLVSQRTLKYEVSQNIPKKRDVFRSASSILIGNAPSWQGRMRNSCFCNIRYCIHTLRSSEIVIRR